MEREVEKRRKMEEYFKQSLKEAQDNTKLVMIGPDCEVRLRFFNLVLFLFKLQIAIFASEL